MELFEYFAVTSKYIDRYEDFEFTSEDTNSKLKAYAEANPYDANNKTAITNFIKSKEGTVKEGSLHKAYYDAKGVLTIGYGYTGKINGKKIKIGDTITEAQATKYLEQEITKAQNVIKDKVKVPLSQNMFDALTSFVYNVGSGNFGSSTLLKLLNKGDYIGASEEFKKWRRSGGKILPGLIARRKEEEDWFTKDTALA